MEGDVITLQDIFLFDFGMGVDEHGRFQGHLKATGVRPKFAEKLADLGIRLGPRSSSPRPSPAGRPGAGLMRRALVLLRGAGRRAGVRAAGRPGAGGCAGRRRPPTLGIRAGRRHRPGRGRGHLLLQRATATTSPTSPCARTAGCVETTAAVPLRRPSSRSASCWSSTRRGRWSDGRPHRAGHEAAPRVRRRQGRPATRSPSSRFNGEVQLVQDFTADKAALDEALDSIALERRHVRSTTASCERRPSSRTPTCSRTSCVFTDGGDSSVRRRPSERARGGRHHRGRGALRRGRRQRRVRRALADIARRHRWRLPRPPTTRPASATLFEGVQSTLRKQYVVTYASRAAGGPVPIDLTVGDRRGYGRVRGRAAPRRGPRRCARSRLTSRPGRRSSARRPGSLLALGLVAAAVVAAVFSIGSSLLRRRRRPRRRPAPVLRGLRRRRADADDGGDGKGQQLAQTALLQRAVDATEQFAERQGFLAKVEGMLERANLPLRAGRGPVLLRRGRGRRRAAAGRSSWATPLAALIALVIVALIPPASLSLPGQPSPQAVRVAPPRHAAAAGQHPAGRLLADAGRRGRLPGGRRADGPGAPPGRHRGPARSSARGGARRRRRRAWTSGDFAWAVMAIRIQREVGGNLAELLVTVADTMTERERLRRDVNAAHRRGQDQRHRPRAPARRPRRCSSTSSTPSYMDPLFDTTVGQDPARRIDPRWPSSASAG